MVVIFLQRVLDSLLHRHCPTLDPGFLKRFFLQPGTYGGHIPLILAASRRWQWRTNGFT